jgi:hypothetical protein
MNKWQIICPLVALFIVALGAGVIHERGEHRGAVMTVTRSIGRDLITTTNSPHLSGVTPLLHTHLSALLRSKTDVATVIIGDERAPTGPGKAWSQLVLTNDLGEALAIRIGPDSNSWFFTVLSYRTITEPGGAANRGQPVGSQTNRTSAAAGPGG